MEDNQIETLDSDFTKQPKSGRRRQLLPWWIKVFTWIFLLFGLAVPVGLVFGILGLQFQSSLYGLATNSPLSILGLCLMAIFALKAVTAFGLWTEKDWAITIGQIDAILGICICIFVMTVYPSIAAQAASKFSFRIELLLLIPFLLKLGKIKNEWMEFAIDNKQE